MKKKISNRFVVLFILVAVLFFSQCRGKVSPLLYDEYTSTHIYFYQDPVKMKKDFDIKFKELKKGFDELDGIPREKRTIKNTLRQLDYLYSRFDFPGITFLASVSTNKEIRETALKCRQEIRSFFAVFSLRKSTYFALKQVKEIPGDQLQGEDRRFLEEELKDFERSGVQLPDNERAKLEKINKQIADLSLQFSKNIQEDKSSITFTRDELRGVPDSVLERLSKDDSNNYHLKMDYPTYYSVMENASLSDVRKRYEYKFYNRAYPENLKIMKKVLQLKKQKANILGFDSFRDVSLAENMAKTHAAVSNFLNNLIITIQPKFQKNMEVLRKLNKEKPVQLWDINYLMNKLKKEEYNVDEEKVREYFPAKNVIRGCMDIYEKLFSIKFEEVEDKGKWHPEVQKFNLLSEGKVIAAIYMDLFPREDKYSHAAQFGLKGGRLLEDGQYESPVVALVCNFTRPTTNKPSLLNMHEVSTFFHEFGHAMHSCLTTAEYSSLAGTAVKTDFVEVPSQMLELWMNQDEIVNQFAGHYKTGEKMPAELLKRLVDLNYLQSARWTVRQAFYALYDQAIHGPVVVDDTTVLWERMESMIYKYPSHKGAHREASFGHLVSGYSARYYSYLWSSVMSADLFTRFEKKGYLNSDLGMEFRVKVLSKGNSVEPEILVKDFLGRKVSQKAFLKLIQ